MTPGKDYNTKNIQNNNLNQTNPYLQYLQAKQSSQNHNHNYEPNRLKMNSNMSNQQKYTENQVYSTSNNNLSNVKPTYSAINNSTDSTQPSKYPNSHMNAFSNNNQMTQNINNNNFFANTQINHNGFLFSYQPHQNENNRITSHILPNNHNNTKLYTPATVRSLEFIPKMF